MRNVRYLLISGQAMRLAGMPRFSMDWDFFIPARDEVNFAKLNEILEKELDASVEFQPGAAATKGARTVSAGSLQSGRKIEDRIFSHRVEQRREYD